MEPKIRMQVEAWTHVAGGGAGKETGNRMITEVS